MNKLVFSLIVLLAGLQANALERKPNNSQNQVQQYLQTQLDNAPNCAFGSKASRSPFDKVGICTTNSCNEISSRNRSFQPGDRAF